MDVKNNLCKLNSDMGSLTSKTFNFIPFTESSDSCKLVTTMKPVNISKTAIFMNTVDCSSGIPVNSFKRQNGWQNLCGSKVNYEKPISFASVIGGLVDNMTLFSSERDASFNLFSVFINRCLDMLRYRQRLIWNDLVNLKKPIDNHSMDTVHREVPSSFNVATGAFQEMRLSYADVAKLKPFELSSLSELYKPLVVDKLAREVNSLDETDRVCNFEGILKANDPLYPCGSCSNKVTIEKTVMMESQDYIKENRTLNSHPRKDCYSKRLYKKGGNSKRELGTKKFRAVIDLDGSLWAEDNIGDFIFEDHIINESPVCSPLSTRTISTSSESDSSSDCNDLLMSVSRTRSLSDCSVESDDSFIVFECDDENIQNESDDELSVEEVDSHFEESPRYCFLTNINQRWNRLCSDGNAGKKDGAYHNNSRLNRCCLEGLPRFQGDVNVKKVRFGGVQERRLVTWATAHRLARKGPWEEMARDRSRFNQRIQAASAIISPILSPSHRAEIFRSRFLS